MKVLQPPRKLPMAALSVITVSSAVVSCGQAPSAMEAPEPKWSEVVVDEDVAPSPPVELFVPSDNPDLEISTAVTPMPTECREIIDPPRDSDGIAGVYSCGDFDQPGTSTEGLAILAGHAAAGIDTEFNRLYQRGDSLRGQEVFVKTETSGDHWLEYSVDEVFTPDKNELPYMEEVWAGDTAGRLVMVTCFVEPDGSSTRNYVAVLQFEGLQSQ